MNASDYALKAATRRLLERVGGYVAASQIVRVGKSTLHRYGDPQAPDFMPIDIVIALEAEAGEAIVTQELATFRGMRLVETEAREEDDHGLEGANLELWQMGADIADALNEAQKHGFTPRTLERAADAYDRGAERFRARLTKLRRLLAKVRNVVTLRDRA